MYANKVWWAMRWKAVRWYMSILCYPKMSYHWHLVHVPKLMAILFTIFLCNTHISTRLHFIYRGKNENAIDFGQKENHSYFSKYKQCFAFYWSNEEMKLPVKRLLLVCCEQQHHSKASSVWNHSNDVFSTHHAVIFQQFQPTIKSI